MASQNTYTTAPDSDYPRRFPFTFPSLDSSEVYVSVAGNLKTVGASNDYTLGNYNQTSGGYIEFVSDTTRGTGTVRVYRLTDGSTLKRDFQAGSAIKADDLNTTNKQAIYLAEEARQEVTNLATSGTSSGFAIDGSNIAPDSITSNKIKDLEVKAADLSSSTLTDSDRAVTTDHIRDNAVTTAKIANDNVTADKLKDSTSTDSDRAVTTNHIRNGAVTDAKVSSGINGTKITPDFGSQNITTTGTLNTGTTTTGSTTAQVLTVTGDATFNNGLNTNGKDVYTNHGAFITLDHPNDPFKTDRSTSTNVDHIWHDDTDNAWNFCSDAGYKSAGNSKIKAGSFYGDGSNLTNLPTPALEIARLSGNLNIDNTSWQTKLTLNITPSTSGTKLFVNMNGDATSVEDEDGSVRQIQVRLRRGSTTLITYATTSLASGTRLNLSFPYKDSYSHNGNQVTYTIQARHTGGGNDSVVLYAGTNIVVQEIL
jgi:hypothetical protein